MKRAEAPLIAHVVHALRVGGLENGLVNLINQLPRDRYRHAVICLTDHDDFARRIERDDVVIRGLGKREGHDLAVYGRLWTTFRELRPAIVHTRNLATLEAQVPAFLAGVPGRVHGEHGRDVHDLDHRSRKYRWLRRVLRPLVGHYIPLSRELEAYLTRDVGVPAARVTRIVNGVDTRRFRPRDGAREVLPPDLRGADRVVVGSVGRMAAVKDPMNLAEAFVRLLRERPERAKTLRLVVVGDGELLGRVRDRLDQAGVGHLAWLPGRRDDVPEILRALDLFVLPSLAEGISNTILEAMASGVPVVATRVGGNAELVDEGTTGHLVPRADPAALASAIDPYLVSPDLRASHGAAARRRADTEFSLDRMVRSYTEVYDRVLRERRRGEPQGRRGAEKPASR
jgi:sugar transferase (PEP-CTERM/EpsH1 system associated)